MLTRNVADPPSNIMNLPCYKARFFIVGCDIHLGCSQSDGTCTSGHPMSCSLHLLLSAPPNGTANEMSTLWLLNNETNCEQYAYFSNAVIVPASYSRLSIVH